MAGYQAGAVTVEQAATDAPFTAMREHLDRRRVDGARSSEHPLRCVWSGYPSGRCSCRSRVPASVVATAWARDLERDPVRVDRFFRFAWQGGVWLGYGLKSGQVRGVYCPSHGAERDQRSSSPMLAPARRDPGSR
jgi:hypothetical protein